MEIRCKCCNRKLAEIDCVGKLKVPEVEYHNVNGEYDGKYWSKVVIKCNRCKTINEIAV